jgi:hypothetical protein
MLRNPSTYSRESILDLDFSTWDTEKVDTITPFIYYVKKERFCKVKKLRGRGEEEGLLQRFEKENRQERFLVAGLDPPANPPISLFT